MFTKSVIAFAGRGVLIGAMFPSLLFAGQPHSPHSGLAQETRLPVVRPAAATKKSALPQKKKQQPVLAKQKEQRVVAATALQPHPSPFAHKGRLTTKVIQVAREFPQVKKTAKTKARLQTTTTESTTARRQKARRTPRHKKPRVAMLQSSTPQERRHSQPHHTPTADMLPLGTFTMRAYTHLRPHAEVSSKTVLGTPPEPGRTVAVDPRIIPLGTRIYIPGLGERIAEDIGRRVKGKRLDVFFPTVQHCRHFGVQVREVMAVIE